MALHPGGLDHRTTVLKKPKDAPVTTGTSWFPGGPVPGRKTLPSVVKSLPPSVLKVGSIVTKLMKPVKYAPQPSKVPLGKPVATARPSKVPLVKPIDAISRAKQYIHPPPPSKPFNGRKKKTKIHPQGPDSHGTEKQNATKPSKQFVATRFKDYGRPPEAFTKSLITKFKVGDFAVANKFAIRLFPPADKNVGRIYDSPEHLQHVELRAESVSMPGRNLNTTTDSLIYGPSREIVNGAGFGGDVAITFNSDVYLSERILFERWQEMCYGVLNWNAKYYNDYIGIVQIWVLDKSYKPTFGVELREVFPKTIGPSDLNSAPSGDIIKIPVTLAYRYWTTLNETEALRQGGQLAAAAAAERQASMTF